MDGLRLPPLIEEVLDSCGQLKDDMCEKTEDEFGEENEDDEEMGVDELRIRMVELFVELEETRQDSQRHQENFLEMRTMLEDERLARAHQAETFSRQMEALKVELAGVRQELAIARQEKQSELEEAQAELCWAEEAALALQEAGEEAAAERENDIACLQEELCRIRAQLQRDAAGRHEAEVAALGTESDGEDCSGGDAACLEEEFASLSRQRLLLSNANRELCCKVKQEEQGQGQEQEQEQEQEQGQEQEQEQPAWVTQDDTYVSVCGPPVSLPDVQEVEVQVQRAHDAGLRAQSECERVKRSLGSLRRLHDESRHECAALEEELRHCKAELRRLQGERAQDDAGGWNLVPLVVAVAAILVAVVPSLNRA
ncbi:coiled-coil domain-containing protein 136 isoform X2 [Syngnathus scovelli]|uniref:coiled-coil domain-containing protein 136 isoform X2 n=1 Tax=Syngnathus scovelli TaxID=161590 RepID=UPI00210F5702|nr:coiled-coil domain-containing protein 136 isoform X2 [Syngnathus scovelli]